MRGYKWVLLKAYFDKGYSLTSYPKWIFAVAALKIASGVTAVYLGLAYTILCFVLGWAWYHYELATAEQEVSNQFNLFVKEMRAMSGQDIRLTENRNI